MELKRISRDYSMPVVAISSFNRENYDAQVSFQAFKESGAIEFSADVLIGLQIPPLPKDEIDAADNGHSSTAGEKKKLAIAEAKKEFPRMVELHILKNRNGQLGKPITYQFRTRFNRFCEGIERPNKL